MKKEINKSAAKLPLNGRSYPKQAIKTEANKIKGASKNASKKTSKNKVGHTSTLTKADYKEYIKEIMPPVPDTDVMKKIRKLVIQPTTEKANTGKPSKKKATGKPVKKVAPVETEVVDGKKPAFEERTWYEFQQGGFLLFINLFLQIFGWSIVMHVGENGLVTNVYPARTSYRGFGPEELSRAYVRVTEFLVKNGKKLLAEAKD